ncbi:MAG: tRNA-binding protein [Salinibacter sp.]
MPSPDSDAPLSWDEFERVDLRAGTITRAESFPEAHTPAYKLWIDFGAEIGTLKSSAQITDRYALDDLEGRQVLGVVNFPPKQIGPFVSECLVTGFVLDDDTVVLAGPDAPVPNGTRLA